MIAIIARLSLHPERRKEVMEWVLLFGTVVPIAYPLIAAGLGVAADGVGAVVTGGGRSTMFPKSWSADRIKEEVSYAYFNKVPSQRPGMWEGITPSGVLVTGYLKPNVTAYPLMK